MLGTGLDIIWEAIWGWELWLISTWELLLTTWRAYTVEDRKFFGMPPFKAKKWKL